MIKFKECPECEGRGTVTYERPVTQGYTRDSGFIEEYEDDCENCGGFGEIEADDEDEDNG